MALPDDDAKRIADELAAEIDRLAGVAVQQALAEIVLGKQAREAVAAALQAFAGAYEADLARRFSELLQQSIGIDEVRAMPIGGIPLSSKLYLHTQQTSAQVAAIVQDHVNGVHQARALALRLYDGYDHAGAADRPLEGRARADLPRELLALTRDEKTRKSLEDLILKGAAKAQNIRTPALRAAYSEAFDAWAKGNGDAELRRKVDIAMREKTRYMANRIARTEIARAHQAQVGREIMGDDGVEVVQWLLNPAHPVADICDLHAKADLYGLGKGCYPKGLAPVPPAHPHCLTGDTLITASGRILSVSKRWFDGDIVIITTASGKRISATVNHPILTSSGWVRAGSIHIGCDVIARDVAVPVCRGVSDNNHQDVPTSISEIVDAFLRSSEVSSREVPVSAEYFHGDGVASKIAVIGTDRKLGDRVDSAFAEVSHEFSLYRADAGKGALLGNSGSSKGLEGLGGAANGVVGGLGHGCAALGPDPVKADDVLLGDRPQLDAGFDEPLGDSLAADAELARKIQDGSTGPVFADEVVDVKISEFSGHVYNLETETGHYTGNSIVNHNCFCRIRPRRTISAAMARELPGGVAAYLRRLPVEDAARIVGSRDRLQQVLDGASLDDVLNAGKDRAYHLRRLGDAPDSTIGATP